MHARVLKFLRLAFAFKSAHTLNKLNIQQLYGAAYKRTSNRLQVAQQEAKNPN